jgi:hypothetical protein
MLQDPLLPTETKVSYETPDGFLSKRPNGLFYAFYGFHINQE